MVNICYSTMVSCARYPFHLTVTSQHQYGVFMEEHYFCDVFVHSDWCWRMNYDWPDWCWRIFTTDQPIEFPPSWPASHENARNYLIQTSCWFSDWLSICLSVYCVSWPCSEAILWTAQPFKTKLVIVIYYHEVECHAKKKLGCYLQGQGHSEGLYNLNVFVLYLLN